MISYNTAEMTPQNIFHVIFISYMNRISIESKELLISNTLTTTLGNLFSLMIIVLQFLILRSSYENFIKTLIQNINDCLCSVKTCGFS